MYSALTLVLINLGGSFVYALRRITAAAGKKCEWAHMAEFSIPVQATRVPVAATDLSNSMTGPASELDCAAKTDFPCGMR